MSIGWDALSRVRDKGDPSLRALFPEWFSETLSDLRRKAQPLVHQLSLQNVSYRLNEEGDKPTETCFSLALGLNMRLRMNGVLASTAHGCVGVGLHVGDVVSLNHRGTKKIKKILSLVW